MDAWEELVDGSTIDTGDAWEHLLAQGGTGGDPIIIGGDASADAIWQATAEVTDALSANVNDTEVTADVAEILSADANDTTITAEVC